jgi:protein O-mannosyl-transferase
VARENAKPFCAKNKPLSASQKSLKKNPVSRPRLIALLLALTTLLAYLPATHNGFVNYDDPDYVTHNQVVQNGLTWAGIQWAFTTWHASNWHPLTWLSLMLDAQLFGLNAGAFHFVNVLFHAANTALLFLLLFRLTRSLWSGAFIAALFAWHPLHVESVAWVSERKDVLSVFFALLALLSYTRYAQSRSKKTENRRPKTGIATSTFNAQPAALNYSLTLLFFAFSLLAKPMFVTLPCVLLLLDFWPLQRFPDLKLSRSTLLRLGMEKWPFFLLTAILCVITCLAQHAAVIPLQKVSLGLRLENSLVSYVRYVFKIFWPTHLAFFYPLVAPTVGKLVAAAIFLGAISLCTWRTRRAHPYLLIGWLWFLGTLVPVIGLVQVGEQAMADRYSYFPSIGIFIMVTFGVRDLMKRFKLAKAPIISVAVLILAACLALTEKQVRYWRNDESLFGHAVAVTKNNEVAYLNLGSALEKQGRKAEAMADYRKALAINPNRADTYNNIGDLLDETGHPHEALAEYKKALQLNPNAMLAHVNLGALLVELGRFDDAMKQFKTAARLAPNDARPHYQMGKALLKEGQDAAAVEQLREALRLDPNNFPMLTFTARVLAADDHSATRNGTMALALATKANNLTGGEQPLVLDVLGMACAENGDFTNAIQAAQTAVQIAAAAHLKNLDELQRRLRLYKNHQPWRESFLATNSMSLELPEH